MRNWDEMSNEEIIAELKKEPAEELKRLQALPLEKKIEHSIRRIKEFYEHYDGKVYVSFSGGKDSLVLLDLVRSVYPNVLAVYCNTGVDFPSMPKYIHSFGNVKDLYPVKHFPKVLKEDGVVFPSKNVAQIVKDAKKGRPYALQYIQGKNKDGTESSFKEMYKKWTWLVDSDVKISDQCCDFLKEIPARNFERESGLKPFVGLLAEESQRRKDAWMKTGCNNYNEKRPSSKPLSIWTTQDILQYIIDRRLPLNEEYGEIRRNNNGMLYTTGEQRTGCVFCAIPLRYDNGKRLQRVQNKYPKFYDTFINKLGLGKIYDKLGIKEYKQVQIELFPTTEEK